MRGNISVCMATYNGKLYIEKQLISILSQLILGDELIIIDDQSSDGTIDIINSFRSEYIKLYINDINLGHVKTFEKALALSKNDYICFSDQDDEWIDNRVQVLYNKIQKENVYLVSSNYEINIQKKIDKVFLRLKEKDSKKYIKNILNIFLGKAPYYGCTMIIKKEFKNKILPIPEYVEAHDLWMAMAANVFLSNSHLEDNTLRYRIHDNNTSLKKRPLKKKIKTRFNFLKAFFNLILRKFN